MATPLVSVIIPIFNIEAYLDKCISSIVEQTYENLEIILIDDGSNDQSPAKCDMWAKRDKRIIVYHTQNGGVSEARNTGLNLASGEYICFVDGDDWLDAEAIQESMCVIQRGQADVVMWSYIREYSGVALPKIIIGNDRVFEGDEVQTKLQRRMVGVVGDELARPENADVFSPVWGKIYRASLLDEIRFEDVRKIGTFEDGLFNYDVFQKAKKVVFLEKNWSHYRKTNGKSLTAFNGDRVRQWETLLDALQERISHANHLKLFQEAYNNRICVSVLGKALVLSRSNLSYMEQRHILQRILNNARCMEAFSRFSTKQMPIQWKVFFFFCKKRKYSLIIAMTSAMNALVKVSR